MSSEPIPCTACDGEGKQHVQTCNCYPYACCPCDSRTVICDLCLGSGEQPDDVELELRHARQAEMHRIVRRAVGQ